MLKKIIWLSCFLGMTTADATDLVELTKRARTGDLESQQIMVQHINDDHIWPLEPKDHSWLKNFSEVQEKIQHITPKKPTEISYLTYHSTLKYSDPNARFTLAMWLNNGQCAFHTRISQETKEARVFELLRCNLKDEHLPSIFHLAQRYASGKGVKVNRGVARVLYVFAAERNYAPAHFGLAQLLTQHCMANEYEPLIQKLFLNAAASGLKHAYLELASFYETRDLHDAFKYYEHALACGFKEAHTRIHALRLKVVYCTRPDTQTLFNAYAQKKQPQTNEKPKEKK